MTIDPGMLHDPEHPLNKTPFTSIQPQPADISLFNAALVRCFGREDQTGRPWIRCIWAQSQEHDEWGWIAKDWNEYGDGGRGQWRARYLYSSERYYIEYKHPDNGTWCKQECWTDIPPPRFVLEKLIPPDTACLDWNKDANQEAYLKRILTGSFHDQEGDKYSPRKPVGGFYVPLEYNFPNRIVGGVIAEHDGYCCRAARMTDSVCYGWYVTPGGEYIEIIERLARLVQQAREQRPGLQTQEEAARLSANSRERNAKYWDGFEDRIGQITREAIHTHIAGLEDDPSRNHHGKFHWMSSSRRSGATAAQVKEWTLRRINKNASSRSDDNAANGS